MTTLGQGLPVGATYEDPTGNVTLTVRGVRLTGGLLLADAEACAADDAIPGLPIQPTAWQLRVRGQEQPVPRVTARATRTGPPARLARHRDPRTRPLLRGQGGLRAARGRPTPAIVFTQLSHAVAWRIRS